MSGVAWGRGQIWTQAQRLGRMGVVAAIGAVRTHGAGSPRGVASWFDSQSLVRIGSYVRQGLCMPCLC